MNKITSSSHPLVYLLHARDIYIITCSHITHMSYNHLTHNKQTNRGKLTINNDIETNFNKI